MFLPAYCTWTAGKRLNSLFFRRRGPRAKDFDQFSPLTSGVVRTTNLDEGLRMVVTPRWQKDFIVAELGGGAIRITTPNGEAVHCGRLCRTTAVQAICAKALREGTRCVWLRGDGLGVLIELAEEQDRRR